MADEPTQQELIQFWKEHQEQERLKTASQKQHQPTVGTQMEQKPQQDYASLKAEWQKRRGLATGHEEDLVMTEEQKQQQKDYLKLKSEFYRRMGREMPEKKQQQWENRLKKDQAKYSR